MRQLVFNHMSLCLGTRLQCLVTIGLGLTIINPSFKSKTIWLNQQLNAMLNANKQALKLINKSTKHNKDCMGSKELTIPIGNHVLLRDHPEGRNKIHNRHKSDIYVMVGHHKEPNVYYIQLLNPGKKDHPKVVNHHKLFDLNQPNPPSMSNSFNGDFTIVLSFLHPSNSSKSSSKLDNSDQYSHHYNMRSKGKATIISRQVVAEAIVTHL